MGLVPSTRGLTVRCPTDPQALPLGDVLSQAVRARSGHPGTTFSMPNATRASSPGPTGGGGPPQRAELPGCPERRAAQRAWSRVGASRSDRLSYGALRAHVGRVRTAGPSPRPQRRHGVPCRFAGCGAVPRRCTPSSLRGRHLRTHFLREVEDHHCLLAVVHRLEHHEVRAVRRHIVVAVKGIGRVDVREQ
jgi:hypothetical protein